jgi:hypothetical protein
MTDSLDQVAQLAEKYKQWSIGAGEPGQVFGKSRFEDHPERSYTLKNSRPRKFLQYEHQTWGINLGWTEDASSESAKRVARWFFTRNGARTGPITFGETIALANGKGGFWLHYAEREFGIDLEWFGQATFAWTILGGKVGQPPPRGQYLAVYNEKIRLFFVEFDRDISGDLGWSDSKAWLDQFGDKFVERIGEYGKAAAEKAIHAYFMA